MSKDPASLGFKAKSISENEMRVLVTIIAIFAPACAFFWFHRDYWWILLTPIPALIVFFRWTKGNAINRTEAEFKKALSEWRVPRQFAALHINGNRRPDREPLYGDTNPLKRSEDIEFMLNRLEEICEHDSKNLFGHKFFKENFWELLKFYWIYADDLIIDEQKTDQNKWSHIFPTYKKYRDIFNDHPQANDREYSGAHNMQPIGLLRQELNRTGSHQW